MFGYSPETLSALFAMVLTGGLKTIYVQIYFQLGFGDSLLITILYALACTLTLPIYTISSCFREKEDKEEEGDEEQELSERLVDDGDVIVEQKEKKMESSLTKIGSSTGLTAKSVKAVQWIHYFPFWSAPFILSIFNVFDSVLRWSSIRYMPASVSEMLITGLELVASVLAARIVRKRLVPKQRLIGVGITIIGLIIVGGSGMFSSPSESKDPRSARYGIGCALLIGKINVGVVKDLIEELFLQEAGIPVLFLGGGQGICTFLLSTTIYFLAGPSMGYHPVDQIRKICQSDLGLFLTLAMIPVFFAASVSNIFSTAYTSSVSRNMWRNFRGLVVWIVATAIFYSFRRIDSERSIILGEEFTVPASILILVGFAIMICGLYVYYISPSSTKDVSNCNDPKDSISESDEKTKESVEGV